MIPVSFLNEVDRFELALKKRVHSRYQGEDKSSYTGQGLLFKDHKAYVPGDDFRHIDWRVYARTEELYVKQFEEEHSETLHLLLDASGSMDFGDPRKYGYAGRICLALAYLAAKNNDRFHVSTFNQELHHLGKNTDLVTVLNAVNNAPVDGETRFREALQRYSTYLRSQSVLIFASDFLFPIEDLEHVVAQYKKNDIVLMQVLTEDEIRFGLEGERQLRDLETGENVTLTVSPRMRETYQERLLSHTQKIQGLCDQFNIPFIQLSTANDVFDAIFHVLHTLQHWKWH